MTRIALCDTAPSLAKKARLYSRVYESPGHEFRVMNMLDILSKGYDIHFVDAKRDARNDAYLDSLTLCDLENHDALKKPSMRRYRRWRENPWSYDVRAETGMVFRNLAMMENIPSLLKARKTPTLVIHSGGSDHLLNSTLPFTPSILAFAPDGKTIDVFAILLLEREKEEKFQKNMERITRKPKLNLVASFEEITAAEHTRYRLDWENWRKMCEPNGAERYIYR